MSRPLSKFVRREAMRLTLGAVSEVVHREEEELPAAIGAFTRLDAIIFANVTWRMRVPSKDLMTYHEHANV